MNNINRFWPNQTLFYFFKLIQNSKFCQSSLFVKRFSENHLQDERYFVNKETD